MTGPVTPPDPSASRPPAGFYADPDGSGGVERFWDGAGWTEHTRGGGPGAQPDPARPRRRVFLGVFLAVQALFAVAIAAGLLGTAGDAQDCGGLTQETCNEAEDAGTAIGVFAIVLLWALVDVILGVVYLVARLARR